jgi:adenylate kinase family enzyme
VKLHIIGIPSAGKTTLAKGMSRLLGVPLHDLDSLAFVDERWTLRPIPERDEMVARILEEPSFVSEGGFLGWTEALFAAADHIVWLDPPLRVLVWRHVRRHRRHPWLLPSLLRFQVLSCICVRQGPGRTRPTLTRRAQVSRARCGRGRTRYFE